jgi:glycosyltransferase involved in cell wall biosynthesis
MKHKAHKKKQDINNSTEIPKMGIHWLSNATWAPSGYGVQARLYMPRIKALGYVQSMTAFYGLQGHTLNMNGDIIFPMGYHPYGLDVVANNAHLAGADIVLTNMDAWVCDPAVFANTRWVPWFPVDSDPMPKAVETRVRAAFDRIVYTKFALSECERLGIQAHYVPMGVDTKIYFPTDRAASKEEMNIHIPLRPDVNKFLVTMVAMNKGNPSRKAFIQNIRAFQKFHETHPDTALYLHTGKCENGEMGGINLPEYIKSMGLEHDVFFPDMQTMMNGYPDDFLNAVYNASDVLLACTLGEGFGIPIIEAQSAGCPVIVGDWTSMPELVFAGWKVDRKDTQETQTFLNSWMFSPNWQAIVEKLELAYEKWNDNDFRAQARAGALEYDADLITEKYWKPVLEKINARVMEDKERKIAKTPQARVEHDTLLIQQTCGGGEHALQMGLTANRNIAYCTAHGMDYQAIYADIDGYDNTKPEELGWGKVALIRKAMNVNRYKNIIWLDADTIIADISVDLRDACTPDKIGAVWHELRQNDAILKHWNVGVLAVSNTELTRKFMDGWLKEFPGKPDFPWFEQGVFNRLGEDMGIIHTLGAEWNSVDYVNPHPHPIIMGFHGYQDRLNVMKTALAKLEGKEKING